MTVTDNPLYLIAFVSPLTNTVDFNLHTMAIASDVLNHLTGLLFVDTAPIIEAPTRIVFQNMACNAPAWELKWNIPWIKVFFNWIHLDQGPDEQAGDDGEEGAGDQLQEEAVEPDI